MPSQRLLKMMDPLGHLTGPSSTGAIAVIWAPARRTADWITSELTAVGVGALRATAFRHVDTSLRRDARPACALAVIDFDAISDVQIATLTTLRWTGYAGPIIAVAATPIAPELQAVVRIDAVVRPGAPGTPLRELVSRIVRL